MKKTAFIILAALLAWGTLADYPARADDYQPETDTITQTDELFTTEELDELLAPIALYPDPLIAQILPAATFVDQIDEAARYVKRYGQAGIDDQPWDISVRAVAHYPTVLFMMDQKYDWCVSLGQAYINQPQEVLDTIQFLRAEARKQGNLVSTPQQTVVVEEEYVRIIPAEPQVIYVPTYDPIVVYSEPLPTYGFISFGIGFTIGAWLNRDCDWHQHRVYYHGWRGGDWIDRSRRHIHTRRNIYIRDNYATINVNRRIMQHNTQHFRQNIRRNIEYRREHGIGPTLQPRDTRLHNRQGKPGTPPPPATRQPRPATPPTAAVPRPAVPRAIPGASTPPRPAGNGLYRGRVPREGQPATSGGFGGYGNGKEATRYRERGQTSRQNIRPQQPPVNRALPAVTGGRQSVPVPAAPRQTPPAGRGGEQRNQR